MAVSAMMNGLPVKCLISVIVGWYSVAKVCAPVVAKYPVSPPS